MPAGCALAKAQQMRPGQGSTPVLGTGQRTSEPLSWRVCLLPAPWDGRAAVGLHLLL